MNTATLVLGILLGLAFSAVMVFRVLPVADQIVKRERGIAEAVCLTRFCALCIALPFYVFTIWMTVVIVADSAPGISVLQEICGDDYECSSTFSMGRTNHDLDACTSADCGLDAMLARSGSQPLNFPRLGLGSDLEPFEFSVEYSEGVVKSSVEDLVGACSCVETELTREFDVCSKYPECASETNVAVTQTVTEASEADGVLTWSMETDSAKQFTFQTCKCATQECSEFSCDGIGMEYYYPNVFYAGAATILFVLPTMIAFYATLKTQIRKVIKCNEMKMYVYNQEAGMQEENIAENLATGGFAADQQGKTKYRTFSKKDLLMILVAPVFIGFFSWTSVLVAGRVGLAFVGLSAGLIALFELISCANMCRSQQDKLADRKARNNPRAERNYF